MKHLLLAAFACGLVACGHPNPPKPKPPALTPAQAAWVRDVCVPAAMAGEEPYGAVPNCRKAARYVIK